VRGQRWFECEGGKKDDHQYGWPGTRWAAFLGGCIGQWAIIFPHEPTSGFKPRREWTTEDVTEQLRQGRKHPCWTTLNNVAQPYRAQGAHEKALQYYEEAHDVVREKLGDWHPSVTTTLNNIALIYKGQGAFEKMLHYYEEALEIWGGMPLKSGERCP